MAEPKGGSAKTVLITVGITAVVGTIAYLLFLKKSAPGIPQVPPLLVTGWNNGTFNYKLGTMTGQITPSSPQGMLIRGANPGPYSLQISDYDGTGYDIIALNGSVQNSIYVNGTGSFSFLGRPGVNRRLRSNSMSNFLGRPGVNRVVRS